MESANSCVYVSVIMNTVCMACVWFPRKIRRLIDEGTVHACVASAIKYGLPFVTPVSLSVGLWSIPCRLIRKCRIYVNPIRTDHIRSDQIIRFAPKLVTLITFSANHPSTDTGHAPQLYFYLPVSIFLLDAAVLTKCSDRYISATARKIQTRAIDLRLV